MQKKVEIKTKIKFRLGFKLNISQLKLFFNTKTMNVQKLNNL